MRLDRDKFWKAYHRSFDAYGPTTHKTVDGLNDILDRFETETRLPYVSHYAYTLATSYHETGLNGNHFVPVKEGRERASSPRRANQDRYWKTGFYGRGHTQTTWEENYRKLGKELGVGELFVQNPDLLLTPKWSYESLVHGLSTGMYRSDSLGRKKLSRYLKGDDASLQDYVNARDVVNGDVKKNGLLIANYAEKFEHILISAAEPAELPTGKQPADEEIPAGQPQDTANDQLPSSTNAAAKPSIWDRLGTWQEKLDKVQSFGSSLSPISGSSRVTVITTKVGGWALMAIGLFADHWLWIVTGTSLIVLAVWYLAKSKQNAAGRTGGGTQTQSQTVVVEKSTGS